MIFRRGPKRKEPDKDEETEGFMTEEQADTIMEAAASLIGQSVQGRIARAVAIGVASAAVNYSTTNEPAPTTPTQVTVQVAPPANSTAPTVVHPVIETTK